MLSGFEPEAAMGGRGSAGAWRRSTENGGSLREQEVEQQLWRGCASLVGVEALRGEVWSCGLVGRREARQGQLEWCLSACIKPGRRDLSLFSFYKGRER